VVGDFSCNSNVTFECSNSVVADCAHNTVVPAECLPRPDAQIRLGSGSFVGDNMYNTDALGQKVFNSGVIDQKLTFFIKIQNDSVALTDSFKVNRSSGFTNGYRVRYYNAAGTDVTGKVNVGTFTTPSLVPGSDYVMRATVKIKSWATPCSFTSRLITVSSVADPTSKDAVRFTAALAPGCPHLTISPGWNEPPGSDSYDLPVADIEEAKPLTFTVTNNGSAASDVLGFNLSGLFALENDSCTGSVLPAHGGCSFKLIYSSSTCIAGDLLGVQQVTGGLPPTTVYLTLNVFCEFG
jgi:hypothetical protein